MRFGAVFVAVCMVLIAGSAGAVLHFAFGLSTTGAIIVAVAVLAALGLHNGISTGLAARSTAGRQLRDLSRGNTEMARQMAELARRVAELESRLDGVLERTRAATDPLAVEIGELGTLLKQLAETVAVHETMLNGTAAAAPTPANARAVPPTAQRAAADAAAAPAPAETPTAAVPAAAARNSADEAQLATIRAALEASRVDLFLQPIVSLPQRKVRYYEAMTRLRTERGEVLLGTDFLPLAETAGLMPKVDNLALFRCVQVIRRLLLKNREIGLFCNISIATLSDVEVFPHVLEFLDANRAIAPSIILELTQSALRAAGPIETESLAALAERGFRFSLDNLTDLRLEPRELANRGFRFVKIPADVLLNRCNAATSDIHPADLSDLLGRFGIDLVVEKIESEGSVVDLLDYDVRFGQGFLFSPPRQVRADALQSAAGRGDVPARESAASREAAASREGGAVPQPNAKPDADGGRRAGLAQIARRI